MKRQNRLPKNSELLKEAPENGIQGLLISFGFKQKKGGVYPPDFIFLQS